MRQLSRLLIALSLLFLTNAQAQVSARIEYAATPLGGSLWRYDYTVVNTGLTAFDELTIDFDATAFSGLNLLSSPTGWDSLVVQADPAIPAAGFLDSLSNSRFLSGAIASGFAVSFNFLGTGTPSSQPFTIVDPSTFDVLASGVTSPVPEASTWLLMPAGILILLLMRGRRA